MWWFQNHTSARYKTGDRVRLIDKHGERSKHLPRNWATDADWEIVGMMENSTRYIIRCLTPPHEGFEAQGYYDQDFE